MHPVYTATGVPSFLRLGLRFGHNDAMRLDDLPIFPFLPEIADALRCGSLVLSAETGAGKTSAVPAYLAERRELPGKAIILEPRRLAAVSAAARVAELLGEEPGGTVGYRVRGDSRTGPRTVVEFVTEAVFIRIVQDDPLLTGVHLVAFDEFHERSALADLGLAFAAEAREARGDLSILVMSATMDTAALSTFLECPTIAVPGRLFPIDLSYSPPQAGERQELALARAIATALGATAGDILAFVPGLREMGATAMSLRAMLDHGLSDAGPVEILALHGSMPLREQRAIVSPPAGAPRRVIVSTSIAET
ncbi:MAG: ATP-dependent helicase HrpB, partial [Spirochaetae bacterium HGW-Spirochaetae-7]